MTAADDKPTRVEHSSGMWCASPATAIATVYLRACWKTPQCDNCARECAPCADCLVIGAENNLHPTGWQPTADLLLEAVNTLRPEVVVALLDTDGGAFDADACEAQREGG